MVRPTHLVAAALTLGACSASTTDGAPQQRAPRAQKRGPEQPAAPLRVLVTGFHDWEDLGEPPNVWRCRDNPSCRLLVGPESSQPDPDLSGPLVQALRDGAPQHVWEFSTLPVTWGAYEALDTKGIDVVVNLGLGVYDTLDELYLEQGAYNLRRGADATGQEPNAERFEGHGEVVAEPDTTSGKLGAFDGRRFGDYAVVVKQAREENSYLCNETHLRALADVRASGEDPARALDAAYFVHVPYAADGDYEALAQGVSGLVIELVALQAASK